MVLEASNELEGASHLHPSSSASASEVEFLSVWIFVKVQSRVVFMHPGLVTPYVL